MKKIFYASFFLLFYAMSSFAFGNMDSLMEDVRTTSREFNLACDAFETLYIRTMQNIRISQSGKEKLSKALQHVYSILEKKQKISTDAESMEREFEEDNPGYKDWVYAEELNVQGFGSDYEHYRETLMFSLSRTATLISFEESEDIEKAAKRWISLSVDPKKVKIAMAMLKKEQEQLVEQYLMPALTLQLKLHEVWIAEN